MAVLVRKSRWWLMPCHLLWIIGIIELSLSIFPSLLLSHISFLVLSVSLSLAGVWPGCCNWTHLPLSSYGTKTGLSSHFSIFHVYLYACVSLLYLYACAFSFIIYYLATFMAHTLVFLFAECFTTLIFSPHQAEAFIWVTLNTQQTTPSNLCAFVADLLADFCWHFPASKQFW